MTQDWSKLTVVQLKEHLKERGLPISGKKADLVARLQESDKVCMQPMHVLRVGRRLAKIVHVQQPIRGATNSPSRRCSTLINRFQNKYHNSSRSQKKIHHRHNMPYMSTQHQHHK